MRASGLVERDYPRAITTGDGQVASEATSSHILPAIEPDVDRYAYLTIARRGAQGSGYPGDCSGSQRYLLRVRIAFTAVRSESARRINGLFQKGKTEHIIAAHFSKDFRLV